MWFTPPPTLASNEEFATGTSESASPSVKQVKDEFAEIANESAKRGHVPGEIVAMLCTEDYVPFGMLPCDGQEYSSTTFPDLWTDFLTATTNLIPVCTYAEYASSISTYGQCAKFAVDTTNNTFKTPKIKDGSYLTQAMSNTEIGQSYNESLPNITGTCNGGAFSNNAPATGVFAWTNVSTGAGYQNTQPQDRVVKFDASLSSSVYQDSAKVQGDNVRVRFFVVVANGAVGDSQVAWTQFVTSLSGRANTDLSNITSAGKEVCAHNAMPSKKYIDLTLGANEATYTAPADGYFSWKGQLVPGTSGGWIYIGLLDDTGVPRLPAMQTAASNVQSDYSVFVPCGKGDKISLAYGGMIQNQAWRFIYARGSE